MEQKGNYIVNAFKGKRFTYTNDFSHKDDRSFIVKDVEIRDDRFVLVGENGEHEVLGWRLASWIEESGVYSYRTKCECGCITTTYKIEEV